MDTEISANARRAFAVVAVVAWFGMGLNFILTLFNAYPTVQTDPTLLGNNTDGIAGVIGRMIDFFSYFTIVSNILVAIVMTSLALGKLRPTFWGRVFRLDSLMMISITGIIFVALLAPTAHPVGLYVVTNAVEHYLVPVLVVLTWLIWGPRRWFSITGILAALIIPVIWAVYCLVRGAVINAYPYPFLNVAKYGLSTVLVTIVEVAILGIVIGLIYWGIDAIIVRVSTRNKVSVKVSA